jgi:hypothetical protein
VTRVRTAIQPQDRTMTATDQETTETPDQRLATIPDSETRLALKIIIESIIKRKDLEMVPVILNTFNVLTKFEMYDAEASIWNLKDQIRIREWEDKIR